MKEPTKVQKRHSKELVKSLENHVWKDYEIRKIERAEHSGNISIHVSVALREDQDHSIGCVDLSGVEWEKYQISGTTEHSIVQNIHYGVTYSVIIDFHKGEVL